MTGSTGRSSWTGCCIPLHNIATNVTSGDSPGLLHKFDFAREDIRPLQPVAVKHGPENTRMVAAKYACLHSWLCGWKPLKPPRPV